MGQIIQKIDFEIEGIAPILYNRFHEQAQESVRQAKRVRLSEEDRVKEIDLKLYKTKEGELFIPEEAIKSALINAVGDLAQRLKKGSEKQLYNSSVFIEPIELELGTKKYDFVDERRIVNPMTGGAQMCKRPGLREGWKVSGKFIVSDPLITPSALKERLQYAGLRFGLLSYRPKFGRFIITRFNGGKVQ